jgi:hypothetical protein
MKTRTNLHAGRAPTEREMLKCLEDRNSLYAKIDTLENRLNASAAAATAAQPVYGAYPVPSGTEGGNYPDWSGTCS